MGAAVFKLHAELEFELSGPCATCGIEIALLKSFVAQRRRDHQGFFCPNGHNLVFNAKSREEKLAEELEAANARAEAAERMRREVAEQAARQVAAAKGQVTKLKNRVGNGVCPCCNRSFTNLQRHMHTKHPGFAHEGASES